MKRKRADHLNAKDRKLAYAISNREKSKRWSLTSAGIADAGTSGMITVLS